ncbi:DUF2795 domain-containing protein [Geomonas sp. RF6]|uniref:DUF2795 domain-containing protein n=1 Tax=Geomonas sp. RF6 TaxID=2897342 RepID=UPI001E3A0158|nr:DUF2795 domain-containing protein [Geomonas sp. RF6]UFS70230.1 DUF2795 domain-containing protein [Geomonas sp. RF6]
MTLKPRVAQPLGGATGSHTVANMTRALHGLEFPASKEEMLTQAKHNHAPKEALDDIERLEDQQYCDMEDVVKDYGKR